MICYVIFSVGCSFKFVSIFFTLLILCPAQEKHITLSHSGFTFILVLHSSLKKKKKKIKHTAYWTPG